MASATKRTQTHFGLPVYETGDGVFAVGTEEQANKAAGLAIQSGLWAVDPEFLVAFLSRHNPFLKNMSDETAEALQVALRQISADVSEDAEPIVRALVAGSLPALVDELIYFNGRRVFLANHDGRELESESIPGLPRGRVAYRIG